MPDTLESRKGFERRRYPRLPHHSLNAAMQYRVRHSTLALGAPHDTIGTWMSYCTWQAQKARYVSDHLDAAKRLPWLQERRPAMVRAATRRGGRILCAEEASVARWGSLSSPGLPKQI